MITLLKNRHIVTKFISEINFICSARQGDIVEMGIEIVNLGRTSVTTRCEVRNKLTQQLILTIDKLVFVNLDPKTGKPLARSDRS